MTADFNINLVEISVLLLATGAKKRKTFTRFYLKAYLLTDFCMKNAIIST